MQSQGEPQPERCRIMRLTRRRNSLLSDSESNLIAPSDQKYRARDSLSQIQLLHQKSAPLMVRAHLTDSQRYLDSHVRRSRIQSEDSGYMLRGKQDCLCGFKSERLDNRVARLQCYLGLFEFFCFTQFRAQFDPLQFEMVLLLVVGIALPSRQLARCLPDSRALYLN